MIRHPLHQADHVVVVVAEGDGARQQGHVRHRAQLGERVGDPLGRRLAVDRRLAIGEQRAADLLLLVHQDHARASAAGGERGGQASGAGADDQHVAVGVELVVAVGIGLGRALAEAGHAADEVLVLHPEALRPHEGLVVEARHEDAVEQAVHRAEIGGRGWASGSGFRRPGRRRARSASRAGWARSGCPGRAGSARSALPRRRRGCRAGGDT